MSLKAIRMTERCNYCGLGYTFRSETAFAAYRLNKQNGFPVEPLHRECKRAAERAGKP